MSIIEKLKDATIPSLFAGVASVGVYYILIDGSLTAQVPFMNTTIPVYGAIAGATFVGAEIGELITQSGLLNNIPMIKDVQGIERGVLSPVTSGLGTWLAMRTLISPETDFKNAFIIGAGGDFVGKYAYGMLGNKL